MLMHGRVGWWYATHPPQQEAAGKVHIDPLVRRPAGIAPVASEGVDLGIIGVGGGTGLGGLVYDHTCAAVMLDEPQMVVYACRASLLITADSIAEDEALDIVTGVAGVIPASLALLRVLTHPEKWFSTPQMTVLRTHMADAGLSVLGVAAHLRQQMVAAGERLLATAKPVPVYLEGDTQTTGLVWDPKYMWTRGPPLTGFSHGQAGISFALATLYSVVPDVRYRDACVKSIAYEDQFFSKA